MNKHMQNIKKIDITKLNAHELIHQEQQLIKKRIRFLQQSLIKISFAAEKNRPELYIKILETLHSAQLLLNKNKEIQQKEFCKNNY